MKQKEIQPGDYQNFSEGGLSILLAVTIFTIKIVLEPPNTEQAIFLSQRNSRKRLLVLQYHYLEKKKKIRSLPLVTTLKR